MLNTFSYIFLVMLTLALATEFWLLQRQRRSVARHRDHVPPAFQGKISLAAHQKAADYTLAKLSDDCWEHMISLVLILGWTLAGGLNLLDQLWQHLEFSPLITGVCVLVSTLVIMGLLDLPLTAYRTFVTEQRFGFNHMTPALFIKDTLMHGLLLLLFGTPLAALILWLMQNLAETWWLYGWAVWMAFILFMTWAYPVIIAPLFNKFNPLQDEELKQRIIHLLQRTGFVSNGIYIVDGSKRTGHGNAYFTGFGNAKRIVFYDTLIKSLSPNEIEAVLAHELGHFKRKHILKRMAWIATSSLLGFAALGYLMNQEWFFSGLGVSQPSHYTALLLFMLTVPVFTFFIHPLTSLWMRHHEFEADEFATQYSQALDLISALVKLYEENAATLTPDPLYSAYHDSHPPAPVRIAHLSAKLQTQT